MLKQSADKKAAKSKGQAAFNFVYKFLSVFEKAAAAADVEPLSPKTQYNSISLSVDRHTDIQGLSYKQRNLIIIIAIELLLNVR